MRSIFKFRLRPFRLGYVEASRIRGRAEDIIKAKAVIKKAYNNSLAKSKVVVKVDIR